MKQPELTPLQRFTIDRYNFHDYQDPVANSIRHCEIARDKWIEHIRFMYNAPLNYVYGDAEEKLPEFDLAYGQAFMAALTTATENCEIPEVAVRTVETLARDEEARRLNTLRNWYGRFELSESSDEYFYDIAMAFGDPDNITTTDPTERGTTLTPELAIMYFTSSISGHSAVILDTHRQAMERYGNKQSKSRAIGSATLNSVKRFGRRWFGNR